MTARPFAIAALAGLALASTASARTPAYPAATVTAQHWLDAHYGTPDRLTAVCARRDRQNVVCEVHSPPMGTTVPPAGYWVVGIVEVGYKNGRLAVVSHGGAL